MTGAGALAGALADALADAVSLTVVLLHAVPVLLFVLTRDVRYLVLLAGAAAVLAATMAVRAGLAAWPGMLSVPGVLRPAGACDCGPFNGGGPCAGEVGMPSVHVAQAAYLAFALALVAAGGSWAWAGACVYVAAVAWARAAKRCHTVAQMAAGAAVGAVGVCGAAALMRRR